MDYIKTKICSKCKTEKPINDFYNMTKSLDGKHYYCKICSKEYKNKPDYKEKAREYSKKYRKENLKQCQEAAKRYREKNKQIIKEKYSESRKKYREQNVQSITIGKIRWQFNISSQKAEELYFKKLDGICEICGQKETLTRNNKIRKLSIDHNHQTNKIRGLLCSKCNTLLGRAEDSIQILKQAIEYLEKYN